MKKRFLGLILSIIYLFSAMPVMASETGAWYIKRNGNERPGFPADCDMVSSYDGYYIDDIAAENGQKILYLTFDAGYENGNLEKIMNTLRDECVPAAFFLLDRVIVKNTELVKRMQSEGHLVCNHTKNHRDLTRASAEEIKEDVTALENLCKEYTGVEMAKYFRFPEGKYSESALKCIKELGYKTVFWSFAYDDWDNARQPSPTLAIKKILKNTHSGAVILLHPNSATNAQILPELIRAWRDMGYSFGTLDELTSK